MDEELTEAKTALGEATKEYKRTYDIWLKLPLGTTERAEAEKVKNDAKEAKTEAQARIDQILKEKELAQGEFIFPSPFYFMMD
jgi:multidrug resistance efflux pump